MALRGTALTGWTRRGRRRAKACRIGGPAGPRPRPEVTAPGTEKPPVERREAPALPTMERGTRRIPAAPRGAPLPRMSRGSKGDYGVPGAAKNTGDDACLLFENWIGCARRT